MGLISRYVISKRTKIGEIMKYHPSIFNKLAKIVLEKSKGDQLLHAPWVCYDIPLGKYLERYEINMEDIISEGLKIGPFVIMLHLS